MRLSFVVGTVRASSSESALYVVRSAPTELYKRWIDY